ncbi:MAG TPA: radical SAM protein [Nitrolancea sp.]|nr:radical SAM protein [Nitrolancea sp.]
MSMDILLVHSYCLDEDPHERAIMKPYPPLGILYICSYLKSKGFAVQVFDSTFSTLDRFEEFVQRERPPVVGFYANLMTRPNVIRSLNFCKTLGITVIVGGPDSANYPEEYLSQGADIVVIGEGEQTVEELLPHLARYGPTGMQQICGIVYREGDGQLVTTPARTYLSNLDVQPNPDRAAIDIQHYVDAWRQHHGMGSVSLITARGCPYKCAWCSHAVYGYTHRRRSPEHVADELQTILETYKPDMVWYADDVFTIHKSWFFRYADELRKRGIRIPFETISREDRLNEDIIRTLAEIGCYRIWVGAESGSQNVLDAMNRRTKATRVEEVVHQLQRYGIEAGMFIMLGYDGEEMQDLQDTVDLLKRSNPNLFLTTVAYPIKNTPYYKKVQEKVIPMKSWTDGSDRDFTVDGRHSRRFYQLATRWMVNEVTLHQERQRDHPDYPRMAKALVNSKIGRAGMMLTEREVEHG